MAEITETTKIIFLGSKSIGYDCLNFLLSQLPFLNAELTAVFTAPSKLDQVDKNIHQLCKKHAIPTFAEADALFELPESDFLISVQYHQILKAKHLAKAKQLAVNLHMAPLPEYRGCNQFSFAILDQAKTFGTTLHKMDTSVDGGDILFEKRFPIPEKCWVKALYDLTYKASVELFEEALSQLISGDIHPISQQSLIASRGTSFHFRKEINDIKVIDPNWDTEKIERHVRATYFPPYEPPYMLVGGKKVFLKKPE